MPLDSELQCKIKEEIIDQGGFFERKRFIFYLIRSRNGVSNDTSVLDILDSMLIDTSEKYLEKALDRSKRNHELNDKEFTLLSMTAYEKQKEEIRREEEERIRKEEENRKFWEDVNRTFNNGNFSSANTVLAQNVDPEVKEMMESIIKQGFRELAKKHHPDATGDDGYKMAKLIRLKNF